MIEHLLNTTVDVYRATFAADGSGGRTKTDAKVDTIPAMVSQPSAEERALAQEAGARLDYVVHALRTANARRGDTLDVGDGRRLRVVAAFHNSRYSYLRLDCEVQQGG